MLSSPRALVALIALALLLPAAADAKPRGRKAKAAAAIDYELVAVMHLRDRGELNVAMERIQALVRKHPEAVSAHRMYQELAVLSRRNGRLIEAEYRHHLEAAPDDVTRKLLHASAAMAAAATTPSMRRIDQIKDIERALAAAQGSKELRSAAHMVAADFAHLKGEPTEVEEHLRAALEADRHNHAVRADLLAFLASQGQFDEAADLCLDLIDDAPWRLMACATVMPERAGGPGATPEDQDKIAVAFEGVEEDHADDVVILQSLEWVYSYLEEKRGASRLRGRLAELDPTWTPPLERDPYLEPLPGGELTDAEIAMLEAIGTIKEQTTDDAWARVRALQSLESDLGDDASPRHRSLFYRELAFALRHPDVLDRDASRAAAKKALEATPDDPSVLNEWAYMSALDKVDLVEALAAVDKALELLLGEPFEPLAIDPGRTFSDYEIGRAESIGAYVDTRGWVLYQLDRHEEAVRDLYLASLLTSDGTVQGHLGRARYAVGNDRGAFPHLLRALALGTEEEEVVRDLAAHIYEKLHVVSGGLDALIEATRDQLRSELGLDDDLFGDLGDLEEFLDRDERGPPVIDDGTVESRAGHPLLGSPAPDFEFETLTGAQFSKASLEGRVVVIDFWATWCAPCIEALPMMDSLARAFEGEDVTFLAMSLDDSERTVKDFWSYADALNPGMAAAGAADAFAVRGIPATFVLDRRGNVARYHSGFDPTMLGTLTAELVELLEE